MTPEEALKAKRGRYKCGMQSDSSDCQPMILFSYATLVQDRSSLQLSKSRHGPTKLTALLVRASSFVACCLVSYRYAGKGLKRKIAVSSRGFWWSSSNVYLCDKDLTVKYPHNPVFNQKVSLFRGDM